VARLSLGIAFEEKGEQLGLHHWLIVPYLSGAGWFFLRFECRRHRGVRLSECGKVSPLLSGEINDGCLHDMLPAELNYEQATRERTGFLHGIGWGLVRRSSKKRLTMMMFVNLTTDTRLKCGLHTYPSKCLLLSVFLDRDGEPEDRKSCMPHW